LTANQARQDRPRAYVPRCAYTYTYTLMPYPTPCLPTYIHVYIIVYVCDDVCVYLIVFVFALFSLLLSLSLLLFSLLLLLLLSLLALARPALGQRQQVSYSLHTQAFLFYLIISQEYVCIVCIHASLYTRQYMCMYYSLRMYPTDVVYVYSMRCIVLCKRPVCMCSSIHAMLYSTDYLYIVCHGV